MKPIDSFDVFAFAAIVTFALSIFWLLKGR